jgi:undecaprenyl diphosphate synthase
MKPKHVGIILDGNRRWAKERGLDTLEGHKKGLDKAKKTVKWASEKGIKELSLFVFSTENWKRTEREVGYLMNLFETFSKIFLNEKEFKKENIKIKIVGLKRGLPTGVKKMINRLEGETEDNTGMILNIALNYGGRSEIVETVKDLVKNNKRITEDSISKNLWNSDIDLVIRTGGAQRLSNFFIWQTAYAEFLFIKKYWPEFTEKDLDKAIEEYASRKRRYGK